jgi:hypothetical protein
MQEYEMNDPENSIMLRGEHLANLQQYLEGVRLKWNAARGYSDEFAEEHDNVLKSIAEHPEQHVQVVEGMDSICNCGVCPKVREACGSEEFKQKDRRVASEYDVEIGKKYRSEHLVNICRKGIEGQE